MRRQQSIGMGFVLGGVVLLLIGPSGDRAAEPARSAPAEAAAGRLPLRIPHEPEDVDPERPEDALPAFDAYCWECFLALNAAVPAESRGEFRRGKRLALPGENTVWMKWRSRDDLFPTGEAREPLKWDAPPAGGGNDDSPCVVLSCVAKVPTLLDLDINEAGSDVKSFLGPVIAQNGEYARFEIRYNRIAYQHILDRGLWDWHYLPADGEVPDEFPTGSVVMKAAWRVISDDEQDFKNRVFWTKARLLDPFNPAVVLKEATVGLVGLHVVHKTAKRPQWIWSSFEHVDNVPDGRKPIGGKRYSFNYGTAWQGFPPENLDSSMRPGDARRIPVEMKSSPQKGPLKPTQVVRENPVHPRTEETNRKYQKELAGTVWENYKLVVTQFPTRPEGGVSDIPGDPFPKRDGSTGGKAGKVSVANSTMETYVQQDSCMACHTNARRHGVAFVFSPGRSLLAMPRPAAAAAVETTPKAPAGQAPKNDMSRRVDQVQVRDRALLGPMHAGLSVPAPAAAPAREAEPQRAPSQPAPPPAAKPGAPGASNGFDEVRQIFVRAIDLWKVKNGGDCEPDIKRKHGAAFGWTDGKPWRTWEELKAARFAPGSDAGAPLVDEKASTVREMLLIRVLRREGVPEARSKRMPMNGPYLTEDQIQKIERFIASQMGKPIE
jgi:mono/diheme cytochrome c family protein